MIYKGKELKTYPEIIDYALKLKGAAQTDFVQAFADTGPHALGNVGYFSGYYDAAKAQEIMAVFKTSHPIFGTERPDAKQAFEAGQQMGAAARKGSSK